MNKSELLSLYDRCSAIEFLVRTPKWDAAAVESKLAATAFAMDTVMLCNSKVGFRPYETLFNAGYVDDEEIETCWGIVALPPGYTAWLALWSDPAANSYSPPRRQPKSSNTSILFYPTSPNQEDAIEVIYYSPHWKQFTSNCLLSFPWIHGVRGLADAAILPLQTLEIALAANPGQQEAFGIWLADFSKFLFERHPAFKQISIQLPLLA